MNRTHLFVIDPQNDFCDLPAELLPTGEPPALPVVGAHSDMLRLASFIRTAGPGGINHGVTVTLDSHAAVAIERTTFWITGDGRDVDPYTQITASMVRSGHYAPRSKLLTDKVLSVLTRLEARGKTLIVWPVHCVTGTWGHNIHYAVASALARYETQAYSSPTASFHAPELLARPPVFKALKGTYAFSEHYGVFEADVPDHAHPETHFNYPLARRVSEGVDLLIVAGEASSHCVSASVLQLLTALDGMQHRPRILLLRDCMSPVPGFERDQDAFFDRVSDSGTCHVVTADQALKYL
jgi:nicotinamidase/pyrazinamidase